MVVALKRKSEVLLKQWHKVLSAAAHLQLCATAQTVVDIGSAAQTGEREASALHHR